jgi:hypothetical protein
MTNIEKELRFLRVYSFASTVVLAVGLVGVAVWCKPGRVRVLDVERLNVLNADGKPALAIAGKGRLPGPMLDGKDYPPETSAGRTTAAGMIFFNESGDEIGGLIYGGAAKPGGYDAVVHLSMDQWKQDQVVVLEYQDDGQRRSSGLRVSDRPTDFPLSQMIPKVAAWKAATGPERERLDRELAALDRDGKFGATRVFVGTDNRSALMSLKDKAGNDRIRLSVGPDDTARLEFLDQNGKVTSSLP